jgi:hypothetical protein
MGANREFARDNDLMAAGHADQNVFERLGHHKDGTYLATPSIDAPQDPQM